MAFAGSIRKKNFREKELQCSMKLRWKKQQERDRGSSLSSLCKSNQVNYSEIYSSMLALHDLDI